MSIPAHSPARRPAPDRSDPSNGARPAAIVCLSPQTWSIDLPTNRQQIMLRAARKGHEILFVETGNFLGRHVWQLVRGPNRRSVLSQLLRGESVAEGIRVRKALNVVPWGHTYELASRINFGLTALVLRHWIRRRGRPTVLWLYDPCTSMLAGRCREALAVYDCVDDYAEQVGGDPRKRALVTRADRHAAARVRLVFATAQALLERHSAVNPRTHLVRNVGDYAHFAPAASRSFAVPELRDLAGPVIGFAGNLTAQKVDLDLLYALAYANPSWTVVLIGPQRDNTQAGLERLRSLPNVRLLGPKPYAELPRYVAGFDVGVIPYVTSTYSRSCFPLKTFEYLAAGKPVVATGLPELAQLAPHVALVEGEQAFLAAVSAAVADVDEASRRARMALAAQNTWETRTERLLGLIHEQLEVAAV